MAIVDRRPTLTLTKAFTEPSTQTRPEASSTLEEEEEEGGGWAKERIEKGKRT